jgi:hypothetical protein
MFFKKIEFLAPKLILNDKKLHPEPANNFIPDWFKELPLSLDYAGKQKNYINLTIKACMPFLDALKTGYILKTPIDIYFNHNFDNPETGEKDTQIKMMTTGNMDALFMAKRMNVNLGNERHHPAQLGEKCPFSKDNKDKAFFKIINPWIVKTPPGYSTLFTTQFNNPDKRFTPLTGIVDTDTFNLPVNFPIIMNQEGEWMLKKYSPIIAAFPFKRDNWKHVIKEQDVNVIDQNLFNFFSHFKNYYKNLFWKTKKWT